MDELRQHLGNSASKEAFAAVARWNRATKGLQEKSSLITQGGGKSFYKGPHGSISGHWYGLKINLDSYLAGKVISGAANASTIAAGTGLVTSETAVGGIAGGVVATALAAASNLASLCQAENGSLTWYFLLNGWGGCNPFS